ncbi:MAG: response regulator [Gemmatimonadaceae bacterium]
MLPQRALEPLASPSLVGSDAANWAERVLGSVRQWSSGLLAFLLIPMITLRVLRGPGPISTDLLLLGEIVLCLLAAVEWRRRWRDGQGSWRAILLPFLLLALVLMGAWELGPSTADYLLVTIILLFIFLPLRLAAWSAVVGMTAGFMIADLRWQMDGAELMRFLVSSTGIFGLALMTRIAFDRVSARLGKTGALLQGSLDAMRQGLVVLAPTGTVAYHNARAATLLGLPTGDAVTPDAIAIQLQRAETEWLATDQSRRLVRSPEGRWLDLATHTLPSGEVVRSLTDVTDYEEARLAAESDASARSSFLGSMSHELRTPLNAILGVSHLLQRTDLSARQRGWLGQIQESGRHLQALVNDALDLSQVEMGRLTLAHEPFALADVVERVTGMLGEEAARKGLRTEVEVDPTLPAQLVGDRHRLTQILVNYVSNAVKYTAAGQITVRLTRLPDSAERVLLRMEVTDTGVGLSEVQQATVFHPYVRFAHPRADAESSGLGLAIVESLATLMEGAVGVTSRRGEGSTFWCTVRLFPVSASAAGMAPPDAPADPGTLPGRVGARVLVVDDHKVNREIAAELVRQMGLEVAAVGDGPAALERLQRERFDLLLLDLTMPGMDGYAVARAVRAMPQHATMPIIAVTANARAEDRERVLAAGMVAHLGKPFEPAQLFALLDRWIPVPPLPAIRGLRYDAGVRLVAGNHALYRTLLRDVAREHRTDVETIARAIEGEDRERAQRIVHTLKGVTGAIAAVDAHGAATALDEALRRGDALDAVRPMVEGLRQAMEPLLADLDAVLAEAPAATATM